MISISGRLLHTKSACLVYVCTSSLEEYLEFQSYLRKKMAQDNAGASEAADAVLLESAPVEGKAVVVEGLNFDEAPPTLDRLVNSMLSSGFQASNLGLAIDEVNRMIHWRMSDEPVTEDTPEELRDPEVRAKIKCIIWLSFTSNMISCGRCT
jgi:hypothetical protein